MAKEYDEHMHTHVTIDHKGDDAYMFKGVWSIVLHTGKYVWIQGGHEMIDAKDVKQVGDGRDNGFDAHGGCILSIPAEWCQYYNHEEAESIERCIDADERLLSYAR